MCAYSYFGGGPAGAAGVSAFGGQMLTYMPTRTKDSRLSEDPMHAQRNASARVEDQHEKPTAVKMKNLYMYNKLQALSVSPACYLVVRLRLRLRLRLSLRLRLRLRFGAVRCGVVRYGAMQYSTVRYSPVRCGVVQYGAVRCGAVRCCSACDGGGTCSEQFGGTAAEHVLYVRTYARARCVVFRSWEE